MKMEWISVKDRLPENGSQVLAIIPKSDEIGFFNPFSCNYDIDNGGFCDLWAIEIEDRFYCRFNTKVTHWMPLPEPPQN